MSEPLGREPPVQEIALALKRVQARHHRTLNRRLQEIGLSLVQWDVLRHLDAHPDASLHELAVLTFQTDQAIGTLARRMTTRGLVERRDGPGRAVRHVATEWGDDLRVRGASIADEVFTESFAPLTASQRTTLAGLLERLEGVGTERADPTG